MNLLKSLYFRAKQLSQKVELKEMLAQNQLIDVEGVPTTVIETLDCAAIYLKHSNVFVDIGTFSGAFSKAANAFHPFQKTLCFEPNTDMFQVIRKNLEGINYKIINAALATETGERTYYVHEDLTMNSLVEADENILLEEFQWDDPRHISQRLVNTQVLDRIIEKENLIDPVFFLKIDTQGNELDILKTGVETLRNTEVVLVEQMFFSPYKESFTFEDLIDFMREQGFECRGAQNIRVRPSKKISAVDFIFVKKGANYVKNYTPRAFDNKPWRNKVKQGLGIGSKMQFWKRGFQSRGSKYYCPMCNSNIDHLNHIGLDLEVIREKMIIGGGKRRAGCPVCFSTDRERLVLLYLRDFTEVFSDKKLKMLHVAPEKNVINILRGQRNLEYVCGDKFTEGYDYPDYVSNVDITNTDFEDNTFDLIICNHVLEHIPDDGMAMRELFRILKPGGQALLQVPISAVLAKTFEDHSIADPRERERVFGQFDHVRIYGQDYVERLSTAGFEMEKVNLFKLDRAYAKYGINRIEDLYIGRKNK